MLHTDSSESCSYVCISDCLFIADRSEFITSELPSWNWGYCLGHFILMTTRLHNWIWALYCVGTDWCWCFWKLFQEYQTAKAEKKKNKKKSVFRGQSFDPAVILICRGGCRGWLRAGVRAARSWQAAPDGCWQGWQSSLDSQFQLEHSVGSCTRLAEPHQCQEKQDFVWSVQCDRQPWCHGALPSLGAAQS